MRRALSLGFVAVLVLLASCKKTQGPVLTKCATDDDCVYTEHYRGDCCVNPCGGQGRAVHRDEAQAIERYNAGFCAKANQPCPQVGACGQPPPAKKPPKCNAGACVDG